MNEQNAIRHGTFLLRLSLGIMFVAHGLLKVLVFTMPGTVGFFESVGFPGFMAYMVVVAELLGGAALIAGFMVRWISLALIPVLIGAMWVHSPNGWVFSNDGGGWEYPAFLAVVAFAQALLGAGAYAFSESSAFRNLFNRQEAS